MISLTPLERDYLDAVCVVGEAIMPFRGRTDFLPMAGMALGWSHNIMERLERKGLLRFIPDKIRSDGKVVGHSKYVATPSGLAMLVEAHPKAPNTAAQLPLCLRSWPS